MKRKTDPDLPEFFHEQDRKAAVAEESKLAELGRAIGVKRDQAVKDRQASGIEAIWLACEEAYLAIDDANRAESTTGATSFIKPTSMSGPLVAGNKRSDNGEVRSNAFVRLTTRYVDMGAAKISEILLPIDDKPFKFSATPVPELVRQKDDQTPVTMGGMPVMAPAGMVAPGAAAVPPGPMGASAMPAVPGTPAPAGAAMPGPPVAPAAPLTVGAIAQAKIAKAEEAAKKAEERIYDWMVESNYPAEMRKVVHDAARIGVGVLKGPFPVQRRSQAITKSGSGVQLEIVSETAPGYAWIDPWNFFPHSACGEDHRNGEFVLERDFISVSQLRELKKLRGLDGEPIYLSEQIDKVIAEGPEKCNLSQSQGGRNPGDPLEKDRYCIWYYTGTLTRDEMMLSQALGADQVPKDRKEVFAIATMVNDTIIRATFNPLDSGGFPYHAMPWSRRAGYWAGVGIAEQISMPQRMVNAATRAMLNNAGKSAGPIHVVDQRAIQPADTRWEMVPDKIFFLTGEGTADDVRKMFMSIELPNLGPQLMAIMDRAEKMAEEFSSIPLISQGQQGQNQPETFGQAELQNSNANTLLRSIAYRFDDHITEPVVEQSYEYLLLDPDVPDDEKGDFKINAHGSIALVEKAIQEQLWIHLLAVAQNPASELSYARTVEQLLKSRRVDPAVVQLTDAEKAAHAQQPPPEPVPVTVAKINEESAIKVATIVHGGGQGGAPGAAGQPDSAVTVAQIKQQTEHDRMLEDRREAEAQRAHDRYMMDKKVEIAQLEFGHNRDLALDQSKTKLADTAMRLNVQKELSTDAHAVDLHKHHAPPPAPEVATPATEPVGTAPPGQAFSA